ncbi:MAG: OB-fold nucleic acid binding domain-containing protein [candidate division WOR-3 bacterium]
MEKTIICFNCGRYIGNKDICPYCGEEQLKPVGIEFLRWISLFLAIGGVIFLFISARTEAAPYVKVKDLKPTMNFAKVSMKGIVESSPYYEEEKGGYFSFWLNDGTGSIKVRAFRDVAKELIEKDLYPSVSDSVFVTGTLYARENFILTINNGKDLKIKIQEPKNVKIKDITDTLTGKRIETEGNIYSITQYRNNSIGLRIQDEDANITVFIPFYYREKEKILSLEKGTIIKVKGAVFLYKDKPEIIPHYVSDISIIGKKEIKYAQKNENLKLKGEILSGYTFKKGIRFRIKTDKGIEEVTLWKSTLEKNYKGESIKLLTGSVVEFEVYEKEYKGKIEKNVKSLKIISYPQNPYKIKEAIQKNIGEFLKIKGNIKEIKEFKAGTRVILEDDTGELTVWIWSDLWEDLKGSFKEKDNIIVVGELKEYKGKIELVPRIKDDVVPLK